MKITIVAGARPNFMKIAPLIHAINRAKDKGSSISYRLVHTGQHYDKNLSETFFKDLNIPSPDLNLGVGSGSQAVQTANIMIKFEEELLSHPCDYVLVVGDVNSTLACTIVAKKLCTKVIHVEAGLRSYDLAMPEEINRMVTDALADVYFTTTPEAGYNLINSGVNSKQIFFVGNTMIDSLIANQSKFTRPAVADQFNLSSKGFLVMTLHRPSNVDEMDKLARIIDLIDRKFGDKKIIFPVHPRTRQVLEKLKPETNNIHLTEPLRYPEFMYLVKESFAVITDSGGIQEETTFLGIPCLTLRGNTERPETVDIGTNILLSFDEKLISEAIDQLLAGDWKSGKVPLFWDGKASERIVEVLERIDLTLQGAGRPLLQKSDS